AAPARRGAHVPAGGGDQRAPRRLPRGRVLSHPPLEQGGARARRGPADVRGQEGPQGGTVKESAGTLLYRFKDGVLQVLIVHPSRHYNPRAPWRIPKGKLDPG